MFLDLGLSLLLLRLLPYLLIAWYIYSRYMYNTGVMTLTRYDKIYPKTKHEKLKNKNSETVQKSLTKTCFVSETLQRNYKNVGAVKC